MSMEDFKSTLTDRLQRPCPVWRSESKTVHKNREWKSTFLHKFCGINSFSLTLRGCGISFIWDILELSGYNAMWSRKTLLEQKGWTTWAAVVPSKGLILWFCDTESVPAPDVYLPKIFLCISLILNMLLQYEWQGEENFMKEVYLEWWLCLESYEWVY